MRKLAELEPELDTSYIMVEIEKAAINAFEDQFLAVLTRLIFHFSQNVHEKIQSIGLAGLYMEDQDFALYFRRRKFRKSGNWDIQQWGGKLGNHEILVRTLMQINKQKHT